MMGMCQRKPQQIALSAATSDMLEPWSYISMWGHQQDFILLDKIKYIREDHLTHYVVHIAHWKMLK